MSILLFQGLYSECTSLPASIFRVSLTFFHPAMIPRQDRLLNVEEKMILIIPSHANLSHPRMRHHLRSTFSPSNTHTQKHIFYTKSTTFNTTSETNMNLHHIILTLLLNRCRCCIRLIPAFLCFQTFVPPF